LRPAMASRRAPPQPTGAPLLENKLQNVGLKKCCPKKYWQKMTKNVDNLCENVATFFYLIVMRWGGWKIINITFRLTLVGWKLQCLSTFW
jgi:hypothetical protein